MLAPGSKEVARHGLPIRDYQCLFDQASAADANGGTRASGTPGYDASVDYVAEQLTAFGYRVERQPFEFDFFDEPPTVAELQVYCAGPLARFKLPAVIEQSAGDDVLLRQVARLHDVLDAALDVRRRPVAEVSP